MASIRSFKAGLSKSYHNLDSVGQDGSFRDDVEENSILRDMNNRNNRKLFKNRFKKNKQSRAEWLSIEDNVKNSKNNSSKLKNGSSAMGKIKSAMHRVSPLGKHSTSRLSVILQDIDSDWAISPDTENHFFG